MKTSEERTNSFIDEKIILSWDDYMIRVNVLCDKVKKSGYKFDYLYGIPRGGAILSHIASHILEIPSQISENDLNLKGSILVMDDIVDTGLILNIYISLGLMTATLYKNCMSQVIPDFYVEENSNWIVFPYEKEKVQ